jgi:thiol-disulfide isomerase/thioredoxin
MKKCTICGELKPLTDFHKQKDRKDGYGNWCKPCKSIKKAEQYRENSEHVKAKVAEYRKNNAEKASQAKKKCYENKKDVYLLKNKIRYQEKKEEILDQCKQYRDANKEIIKQRHAAYRTKNKERRDVWQKQYYEANKPARIAYHSAYRKERAKRDHVYALTFIVRRRITLALKYRGSSKPSKTADMLGCSYAFLAKHLESMFTDGMSWENRGKWHVDHIVPLATAKTTDEVVALCHYTNLQPMWAFENLSKGARAA